MTFSKDICRHLIINFFYLNHCIKIAVNIKKVLVSVFVALEPSPGEVYQSNTQTIWLVKSTPGNSSFLNDTQ